MLELIDDGKAAVLGASIKVIGVGGAGGNAVNRMIQSGLTGVEFIAANTDAQVLDQSLSPRKLQLGATITKGLGRARIRTGGATPPRRTKARSRRCWKARTWSSWPPGWAEA